MEIIKKARNYFGGAILANGGVYSYEDAMELLHETQADGIGIARGALGRPWIFKVVRTGQSVERAFKPAVKISLKHAKLAYKHKVAVPEPISQNRHAIVMGVIEGAELSKWKELENPAKVLLEILINIQKAYLEADIVHADLSDYNIYCKTRYACANY
jgi:tRNA-dihydrouridine synthase